MQGEIDNAAGMIWRYLQEHGETALAKLRQGTRLPDQLVSMGIGWLAREEKLRFMKEGRTVKVALQEHQAS